VLDAVGELIDRVSYRSVTVDAVARASGVSKSTIYRHWPSREVLVLEGYTRKINRSTVVPDTGDAFRDLRHYVTALVACLGPTDHAASTVTGLIVDALADDEFAALYRRTLLRERRHLFVAILVRGQQRGQIRADLDVETAVDAIYGAIHHRLLVSGRPTDLGFVKGLIDVAAGGLAAPAAQA
jgi:AcrR family transcriptional regulator